MFVDLHIHTDASDGMWNVDELYSKVKEANISLFAICDHDEVKNSLLMAEKIEKDTSNINFIKGLESTCEYKGLEYHLTVYYVNLKDKHLLDLCKFNVDKRKQFDEKIIEIMSGKL